jgi:hypothetical protein
MTLVRRLDNRCASVQFRDRRSGTIAQDSYMSEFLQQYVDWGLIDIIFVSSRETEVESGYNLEITSETVVARKDQGFVEVVAQRRVSFAPRAGGSSIGKDSERPITAQEYRAAARGKQILDSPAALAQLQKAKDAIDAGYAREAELRARRAPLYEKFEKLTPKCPNCDRPMNLKEKGGRSFWACRYYQRDCDGAFVNLTAEAQRILAEIDKIA